jgi:ubiquinone/menaquinone biosynthesis C-methylase UbiE
MPDDHFGSIYATRAADYHRLVMREDREESLRAALTRIRDLTGAVVVEMGAGTGRLTQLLAEKAARVLAFDRSAHMLEQATGYLADLVGRKVSLAVAENATIPVPDSSADVVAEGWSWGHTVTAPGADWKRGADGLIAEAKRILRPGGTMIVIETLGTGFRSPAAPGDVLPRFYEWLEHERGFAFQWIRTDYLFPSMTEARELVEFFFESMVDHEVLPSGAVLVPECTGLWWRGRDGTPRAR